MNINPRGVVGYVMDHLWRFAWFRDAMMCIAELVNERSNITRQIDDGLLTDTYPGPEATQPEGCTRPVCSNCTYLDRKGWCDLFAFDPPQDDMFGCSRYQEIRGERKSVCVTCRFWLPSIASWDYCLDQQWVEGCRCTGYWKKPD